MRFRMLVLALPVLLSACNLSGNPQAETIQTSAPPANSKPAVAITSPADGSQVVVNTQVLVSANATDSVGVQRVQLLANGQIVKTVSSQSPSGDTNMNVLLDYTPRTAGTVNLQVIAYRGGLASDPAQVTINVTSQSQPTATTASQSSGSSGGSTGPVIDPNDPTCRILTSVGLNVRSGPDTTYPVLTVLAAGTQVPIVGRNGSNTWWQVRVGGAITGWVSAQFTTEYGNCFSIPVVAAPPTATSNAPTATPTRFPTAFPTLTPQPSVTPQFSDLLVTSFTGPQQVSIPQGQSSVTATFTVTITNNGGRSTGQFFNTIHVTPGNTNIDLGTVSNLDGGQSIVLNVQVTFTAPGDYTLQAAADSHNDIQEQSEVNNIGYATITVG
jgi:SH3 domain-containing protein/CARDB protein/Big-like domain-containing protein